MENTSCKYISGDVSESEPSSRACVYNHYIIMVFVLQTSEEKTHGKTYISNDKKIILSNVHGW